MRRGYSQKSTSREKCSKCWCLTPPLSIEIIVSVIFYISQVSGTDFHIQLMFDINSLINMNVDLK